MPVRHSADSVLYEAIPSPGSSIANRTLESQFDPTHPITPLRHTTRQMGRTIPIFARGAAFSIQFGTAFAFSSDAQLQRSVGEAKLFFEQLLITTQSLSPYCVVISVGGVTTVSLLFYLRKRKGVQYFTNIQYSKVQQYSTGFHRCESLSLGGWRGGDG